MYLAANLGDYAPTHQKDFEYTTRKKKSMEPIIDHIQITVKDMNIAIPFYDKFLTLLGFDNKYEMVCNEKTETTDQ